MTTAAATPADTTSGEATPDPPKDGPLAVFRNGGFLRLWLSQAATQIGGNMVLFGLTVIVVDSTHSNTAVSLLVLSFLVPAVLFSAVAGVYVDRFDRRVILVATNFLRGLAFVGLYLVGTNFALILLLNLTISTITVFFAPAELAMIPFLVPRRQLLAANGIFTLTLNGAFAIGFALLGPLVVNVANPEALILVVAALYFLASVFCFTLPSAPSPISEEPQHHGLGVGEAERAVESTFADLREGFAYIRANRPVAWSLSYLAIAASLVGVLGVLGPTFAQETLGLSSKDFAVVVLPLGFGIVTGILLLNSYGKYFLRRRVIEGGLIVLGVLLMALAAAGPISRLLQRADAPGGLDLSMITSLLAVVVLIAFFAGIAYGLVAIPSQTQLQEDIAEEVRGRVFGVLGMLVSVASFLPIIVVGYVSDRIGTTAVLFIMALGVTVTGIISVVVRGPVTDTQARPAADPRMVDPLASALGADLPTWTGNDPDDGPNGDGAGVFVPPLEVPAGPLPVGPAGDKPARASSTEPTAAAEPPADPTQRV